MKKTTLAYFKNKKITAIRTLSQQEIVAFETARQEIDRYVRSDHLFAAALLNHDEYVETNKKYVESLSVCSDTGKDYVDNMVFNLNRRILNFLSSVRMFLDHNKTELNRSQRNSEMEFFKELLKNNYDESFAYRFLYQLRDYIQHCGMPVGNVLINAVKDLSVSGGKRVTVSVVFDRDSLLSRFDGWKSARKSLLEMPAQFEVALLLQELVHRLGVIHFCLNEKLFPDIEVEAALIRRMHSEAREPDSRVVVCDVFDQTDEALELQFVDLPLIQAQQIFEDRRICWERLSLDWQIEAVI